MRVKRAIHIITLILLMLSPIVIVSAGKDSRIASWYEVTDEEVAFCSKWGGTQEAQQGATSDGTIALSQLTVSLQAQVEDLFTGIQNNTENNTKNNTEKLYKVSWYVEPFKSSVGWSVSLVGNQTIGLDSGSASRTSPGVGFFADFFKEEFTHARLDYGGHFLMVPIVNVGGS